MWKTSDRRPSRSASGCTYVRTYVRASEISLRANCTIIPYLKYIEERSSNYAQERDYYKESTGHAILLVLHMWFVKKYFGSRKFVFGRSSPLFTSRRSHRHVRARNHAVRTVFPAFLSGNETVWNLRVKGLPERSARDEKRST